MGRRGPAPAPTALKVAKGERRPSRVNYDEPVMAPPESSAPPEGLDGEGLAEWQAWFGPLSERGVLTDADVTAFEDYCFRVSRLAELRALATQIGPLGAVGKINGDILKTEASIDRLRDRLGLTPSSRSSVKAAKGQAPKPKDPTEPYLRAITGGLSGAS
jgi:phage terminase small subunit